MKPVQLETGEIVIKGRPDFANHEFGHTFAKTFPPFVFSVNGNALLVHKIAAVRMRWWEPYRKNGGQWLVRRSSPKMIAETVCGCNRFLEAKKTRTCRVPEPNALLCGRCHGEPATFGPHGEATKKRIPKAWAHVQLGCVVNGY